MDIEELIRKVIGAAINVHRELGPGFLESVYEEALAVEFERQGIRYERQKLIPILYHGRKVGEHRLDMVVEDCLIIENKAVSELEPIFFVIVRSYLKATGKQDALLLNFAAMPMTIKRVGPEDTVRYRTNQLKETTL
jgi:GxxExxY protein